MSFQQGLSGLGAASKSLDAIGNNISNSGTAGFKSADARFSDVFAASLSGGGGSQQHMHSQPHPSSHSQSPHMQGQKIKREIRIFCTL